MGHSRRNYHGCRSGNSYGVMPIGKYDESPGTNPQGWTPGLFVLELLLVPNIFSEPEPQRQR